MNGCTTRESLLCCCSIVKIYCGVLLVTFIAISFCQVNPSVTPAVLFSSKLMRCLCYVAHYLYQAYDHTSLFRGAEAGGDLPMNI